MPGVSLYREHFVTKCNKYCKKKKKKKRQNQRPGCLLNVLRFWEAFLEYEGLLERGVCNITLNFNCNSRI